MFRCLTLFILGIIVKTGGMLTAVWGILGLVFGGISLIRNEKSRVVYLAIIWGIFWLAFVIGYVVYG
jgi:hypothetical protein